MNKITIPTTLRKAIMEEYYKQQGKPLDEFVGDLIEQGIRIIKNKNWYNKLSELRNKALRDDNIAKKLAQIHDAIEYNIMYPAHPLAPVIHKIPPKTTLNVRISKEILQEFNEIYTTAGIPKKHIKEIAILYALDKFKKETEQLDKLVLEAIKQLAGE